MEELDYTNQSSFYEKTTLIKRKSNKLPSLYKAARQDNTDYELYFIGQKSQPQTLKAFKQIKYMKPLKLFIITIWIVPDNFKPNQILNYQQLLNNHQVFGVNVMKIKQLKKVVEKELKQNPQIAFQIWFKDQQVLQDQQFNDFNKQAKSDKLKIQFIYFNYEDPQSKSYFKNKRNKKQWKFVAYGTGDIDELKRQINQRNALPNFVYIQSQKNLANILKMGLSYIIKQALELDFVLSKFKELVEKMGNASQREVEQFIYKLKNNQIGSILEFYSEQTFFYKFINNSLRMWKQPTQIYYLQPILKRFNEEIRSLYRKNKEYSKIYEDGKVTFYRGALIQQNQIEYFIKNLGKFVYSLGFLSTSINKEKAKIFKKNALISIICYSCKRDQQSDLGFARIKKKKNNDYDEEQYLFNVFNTFRISKIYYNEIQFHWQIQLIFGELAQYLYLHENKITNMPSRIKENQLIIKYLSLNEREASKIKDQLDIFIKCGYYQASQKYCIAKIKYLSANSDHYGREIQFCKMELINVYIIFQKFQQAKVQLQKIKNKKTFIFCKLYAQTLQGLAHKSQDPNIKKYFFQQANNYYMDCLDILQYKEHKNRKDQNHQQDLSKSIISNMRKKKQHQVLNEENQKKVIISQILHSLSNVTYQLKQFQLSQRFSLKSIQLTSELQDFVDSNSLRLSFLTFKHSLMYEKDGYPCLKSAFDNLLSNIEGTDGQNLPSFIILKLLSIVYQHFEQTDRTQISNKRAWNDLRELSYLFKLVQFNKSQKNEYFFLTALILQGIQLQPKKQTLFACQSVKIQDEGSSLRDGWILLQIGVIKQSKYHLQKSLQIFEQLEEQSQYKDNYFEMKAKAFNSLLKIYKKRSQNTLQDIERLYGHLILMKLDQNSSIKNQYYFWYENLATFYLDLNQKVADQIISDFKNNNKNSLKLASFQINLLLTRGKYKQIFQLKRKVQNTPNIQNQLTKQQIKRLQFSLAKLERRQEYRQNIYQQQNQEIFMHLVNQQSQYYNEDEQIMIEVKKENEIPNKQSYIQREEQKILQVIMRGRRI